MRFITFHHITEAIKYLVSGKDGDHLPYTKEDGKPNHRLMGAAWAALHDGYRGNKYEGSGKSAAITRLKALYKAEKMDTPDSQESAGEFFEAFLLTSGSFDALRSRVQSAIQSAISAGTDMDCDGDGDQDRYDYAYIQDLFPGQVVYSMNGCLFLCDFTDDGEKVTLGTPQEVETSYTPVDEPMGESHRVLAQDAVSLKESAYDESTGELTVTVIKPGFNKSGQRYYPASVLKRDHGIFEGAKMFADHQTEAESKTRPEGSVHNWVANIKKPWSESDGTVKAKAVVIDPTFKAKLDTLNKQGLLSEMGVSIRAVGEAREAEVDGRKTNLVESLLKARSVDFVTFAGAGGQVEAMESDKQNDGTDVDLMTETQLRERRPDLIQIIESSARRKTMKTLEQQLQESQSEIARLKGELTESQKATGKAKASEAFAKMLTESKLPQVAKDRLVKQFAEAISVEGMKEAIVAEQEYVKSLSTGKTTKNLGVEQNGTHEESDPVKVDEATFVESYRKMGLSEKEAKLAAGRSR